VAESAATEEAPEKAEEAPSSEAEPTIPDAADVPEAEDWGDGVTEMARSAEEPAAEPMTESPVQEPSEGGLDYCY
jgi:hypothetical protein